MTSPEQLDSITDSGERRREAAREREDRPVPSLTPCQAFSELHWKVRGLKGIGAILARAEFELKRIAIGLEDYDERPCPEAQERAREAVKVVASLKKAALDEAEGFERQAKH